MAIHSMTQQYVDRLRAKKKPFEVWDKGGRGPVAGLLLRCQPSGKKFYYIHYRRPVFDEAAGTWKSKQTRMRLGRADRLPLKDARTLAKRALHAAEDAVSKKLKGDRVKDQVSKALLGLDKTVSETEAEAEKEAQCRTVEQFIDETYARSLEARRKYAKDGREIARLKFILGLYKDEPGLDILNMRVNAVDHGTIDDWLIKRGQTKTAKTGRKPSSTTVQRDLAAISGLFKAAIKRKLITSNPVAGIEHKATQNEIVRYLGSRDPGEEARLLDALEERENRRRAKRISANQWAEERGYNTRPEFPEDEYVDYLRPLVLLAMHTGLRRGELLSLKWVNVKNLHSKSKNNSSKIQVPGRVTKNGKPHRVPLNDFAASVLRKWKKTCSTIDDDAYVFPGKNGKKLNEVGRAWDAILEIAGIQDFRFHDLRHHFASKLVMAGVPLNTVRELMNHKSMQMTLRYADIGPDHKRDSVNVLAKDKATWTV